METVLITGGGGREHALGWRLAQSAQVEELVFVPGNVGTVELGQNWPGIDPTDAEAVGHLAVLKNVNLVLPGQDAALAAGVVDAARARNIAAFGPTQAAALLESSKVSSSEFMNRWHILHPPAAVFDRPGDALEYIGVRTARRIVIKADGLAGGKGVFLPKTSVEAETAIKKIGRFGAAGELILVEDQLEGTEVSVFVMVAENGEYQIWPSCQDYKRRDVGDRGPNTGGMGAVAPVDLVDEYTRGVIRDTIIEPTLHGMKQEGNPFGGMLYLGLMLTSAGPKVLEYNVRFGDPECQALMPLVTSDLYESLYAAARGSLIPVEFNRQLASAVVTLAARDYPDKTEESVRILVPRTLPENVRLFHGATLRSRHGELMSGSGRALHVVGTGADIPAALATAYRAIGEPAIHWPGMHYRPDIGSNLD